MFKISYNFFFFSLTNWYLIILFSGSFWEKTLTDIVFLCLISFYVSMFDYAPLIYRASFRNLQCKRHYHRCRLSHFKRNCVVVCLRETVADIIWIKDQLVRRLSCLNHSLLVLQLGKLRTFSFHYTWTLDAEIENPTNHFVDYFLTYKTKIMLSGFRTRIQLYFKAFSTITKCNYVAYLLELNSNSSACKFR